MVEILGGTILLSLLLDIFQIDPMVCVSGCS